MSRALVSLSARFLFVSIFLTVPTTGPTPAWSYQETKVTDGGSLEGKVVFQGPPPAPRKIIPTQDQQVCDGTGQPQEQ